MGDKTKRPKRIQRKRASGWRMPVNTIYVGRPTKWGNPYSVGSETDASGAVTAYIAVLDPATVAAARRELRGKNLACWCALDQPCHADILLRIANEDVDQ